MQIVPQVDFTELDTLSASARDNIRRRGVVVIRNVVPDEEATGWRNDLKKYVKENPVEGENFGRLDEHKLTKTIRIPRRGQTILSALVGIHITDRFCSEKIEM